MKSNCEKGVFMIDMNLIDLITDNHNTPFWEISYYWHRTYQAKGIQYQYFVGEITTYL